MIRPRHLIPFALLAACQTGRPAEPVSVPVVLQPLFETCEPNDGAMTLQVFKGGGILTSLELVWKAKDKGDWELEIGNPAGITMLHMERTGGQIKTDGRSVDKLPQLTVLSDGFLAVNGDPVGIKAGEIPCILGYRLPRSWMALARGIETVGRVTTVDMGDDRRELTLTVKDASRDANAVCTRIAWSKWLFFHTHLTWCQNPNAHAAGSGRALKRRQASLSGIDDYVLKWVSADE